MTLTILDTPLAALVLTLGAFIGTSALSQWSQRHPLCNPVLLSIGMIVLVLATFHMPFETYFKNAQFIHYLLGPAVVALAIPLYRNRGRIAQAPLAIVAGIGAGSAVAVVSALVIVVGLGGSASIVGTVVAKSITAPVAMGVSQTLGGIPALTAVLAVMTGLIGASCGPLLLDRIGIHDPCARGIALGTAAHGQGTARCLQESDEAGAFAGLAMGLTSLALAFILPLVWALFAPLPN